MIHLRPTSLKILGWSSTLVSSQVSAFRTTCSLYPQPDTKEGILLRNVSTSLVLSDHFLAGGILELGNKSGKE